jgi:hypothetical protein
MDKKKKLESEKTKAFDALLESGLTVKQLDALQTYLNADFEVNKFELHERFKYFDAHE